MPGARKPLDPALRAVADEPARPGAGAPAELLRAARSRKLTNATTEPGSLGRQAVREANRAVYARRTAGRPEGVTAREAAGHVRPGTTRSMSGMVADPPRFAVFENVSGGEARRLGRYDGLVGQLSEGALDPGAFERRVSRWAPVQGERLLSDPAAVLALLDQLRAEGIEPFVYEVRR